MLLSVRQSGRRPLTAPPDRAWLEERFVDHHELVTHPPVVVDVRNERGDHSLNDGMQPMPPLKQAAVLIGCVDRSEGLTILFTRRTSHLAHHPGQISFPGGHIEAEDRGPAATALRETEEEIGLHRRHVEIIGRLDTYVTRTGFVVTPVVGIVTPPFELRPDADEVAEVFEVPLGHFLDPANHQRCSAQFEGATRYFYAMPYGDYYIWGATAGMLMNLYEHLSTI